jgi:uncharacterized RDD family membrane protein YckC
MRGDLGYRVVTPEAVVLDMPTASVISRALARLLDIIASFLATILAALAGIALGVTWQRVLVGFTGFCALLAYPVVSEALWRGRTLGKLIAGLRVVRTDGGPVGLRQTAVRGALGLFDVWLTLGSLGLITIILSGRDQRLGDIAAGTVVLRVSRDHDVVPVRFLPPPGCEQFVATVDVGAMSAADYEVVRAFLLRWPEFRAEQRLALAAQVAGPLWQRSRHRLPAGMSPDIYLACLGCAYQLHHQGNQGAPGPWLPRS